MTKNYTLSLVKNDGSLLPIAFASSIRADPYSYKETVTEIKMAHSTAPRVVNEFHRQLAELAFTYCIERRHNLERPEPTLITSGDISGAIVDIVPGRTRHDAARLLLVIQVSQRGVRRLGYLFAPEGEGEIFGIFDRVKNTFERINDSLSVDPQLPLVIRSAIDAEPVYGIEGRPGRPREMELTNTVTEGIPKRTFPLETNYEESESDTEMQPLPPTTSEDETSPESE